MTVLTLKAKNDYLKKVAATRDYVKAISEFVWNSVDADLTLRVIEWKPRISGRKIFFGGESGVVLGSMAANVTAPSFEFSAYAYSPFFNEIAKANLLEFDGLTDPDFARVVEHTSIDSQR